MANEMQDVDVLLAWLDDQAAQNRYAEQRNRGFDNCDADIACALADKYEQAAALIRRQQQQYSLLDEVCANQAEQIAALKQLVYDAFGVMSTHEARHRKRADQRNQLQASYHDKRVAASAYWLDRAGPIYNELYAERAAQRHVEAGMGAAIDSALPTNQKST